MSLQSYLEAINLEISKTNYGEKPAELYDPIRYIMDLGGKRMRPALTLMSANMFLYNWQKALKAAVAVEVFHNFTLMHDDIMDQAPLRRGKPTVHEKWNANTAILSGDVMLIAAYELLCTIEDRHIKRVIKRFNQIAAEVCEGQQLDMNFSVRDEVTEEEYIEMIRLKTSVLLGFALELGAIIADADDESIQLLNEVGLNLGIGFQLKDDILDVYGDPEKFGKQVGGDIIENKKTWLMLKALEISKNTPEEKELSKWLGSGASDTKKKVKAITEIYDRLEIRTLAENKMNEFFNRGMEALRKLKVSEDKKQSLRQFADYLMERES
jgi:geranylgeranyl diphosphate synthase type II